MRLSLPRLKMPRLRLPRLPGMFIFAWLFAALKGWVMGSRQKDTDSLVMPYEPGEGPLTTSLSDHR